MSAAPLPVLARIALQLINALWPGLATVITAAFVNALIAGRDVLTWSIAFALLTLVELFTNILSDPAREWVAAAAVRRVHHTVLSKAATSPLTRFHDPAFLDSLNRASHDLPERMLRWFDSVVYAMHAIIGTCALVASVFVLGGGALLAGTIIVNGVIGLLIQRYLAHVDVDQVRRLTRPKRIAEAWAHLLSQRTAASEVRLFGLQKWIHSKWFATYEACAREETQAAAKRAMWNGISSLFGVVAFGVIAIFSVETAYRAGPAQAAGVFTGLLLTGLVIQSYLREVVGSLGHLHRDSSLIGDLADLFSQPDEAAGVTRRLTSHPVSITLNHVSFSYPSVQTNALQQVTATIAPKEFVALVGPNGAGKSTLAAVILNLYRASGGTVLVDGSTGDAGPLGSAVFQEFVRYALPVRDNVGFGDLAQLAQDSAIRNALGQAASSLQEDDLSTSLGVEFGGRDLSGGEWLRVAIARGLLPKSGLLVLDEPTAAIDPIAEVDIVTKLLSLSEDRRLSPFGDRPLCASYSGHGSW